MEFTPKTRPDTQPYPHQDERKPYTRPAILVSLPLEASAGSSPLGRPADGSSSDGWDDEW